MLKNLLQWDWFFSDTASTLAVSVVTLHNTILYVLIIVGIFMSLTVIRALYLFKWNMYTNFISTKNVGFEVLKVVLVKKFEGSMFQVGLWLNFLSPWLGQFVTFSYFHRVDLQLYFPQFQFGETRTRGRRYPTRWYAQYNEKCSYLTIARLDEYIILEYIWALIPLALLIWIFSPSLVLLLGQDLDYECAKTPIIVSAHGKQWYWSYIPSLEYFNSLFVYKFDSYLNGSEDLNLGYHRLLDVDTKLILPVNTYIRFLVTASDVIHCFAIPELALKMDAVPGRANGLSILIIKPGVFYGQCSELCGMNHGYMPIMLKVVDLQFFYEWLTTWVFNEVAPELFWKFELMYYKILTVLYEVENGQHPFYWLTEVSRGS